MRTQTVNPQPRQLTDQPTTWPGLYFLPETHYVRRQRAANSPDYHFKPKPVMLNYRPTRKKQNFLQRQIDKLVAARNRAWLSQKLFGHEVVHSLVKWCILPPAIAACFSILAASPVELSVNDLTTGQHVQTDR
jgi:hypothetical protein